VAEYLWTELYGKRLLADFFKGRVAAVKLKMNYLSEQDLNIVVVMLCISSFQYISLPTITIVVESVQLY